ncbi:hypothetical protein Aperf_G00000046146 [Anoplocephala perfoliata]
MMFRGSRYFFEIFTIGLILRYTCLNFGPQPVLRSIVHAANEDWSRLKEEAAIFRNPSVINASAAIKQPPLYLALWKLFEISHYEKIILPAIECFAFTAFFSFDFLNADKYSNFYPLSLFIFALNPFSVFAFGSHSIGIVPIVLTVCIFISIAKEYTCVASILCALGCYINIYSGYLMLAVLAQCRKYKWRLLLAACLFVSTIAGLLLATYTVEQSWEFMRYCYLSNIYALNTTPNLGLFWYMYVEMFAHFNVFFVWTMQLLICALCLGLLFRFYEDPLFLALTLSMTTGILKPYNSIAEFGCTLALAGHWRNIFTYFRNVLVTIVFTTYVLIMVPLLFVTWLQSGTTNANFYFGTSLLVGFLRVQLLSETISAYLRTEFHEKFGPNPRLSTGAKVVPSIRS